MSQVLSKMAERAKDFQNQQQNDEEADDDLNMLTKPTSQDILYDQGEITWTWKPIDDDYVVTSTLYTKHKGVHSVGDYVVNLESLKKFYTDNNSYVVIKMTADQSKNLGQALLAAYKWEEVWKDYAGDYLWNSLVDKEEKEVEETKDDLV